MRIRNPFHRVPFIAQMEMTECGAASLAMVLAYHRCWVPLAELREACSVSRDGTSALDVSNAAQHYGLEVNPLRTELDGLRELELPAILYWEFNHFVVLERLHRDGADLVDPAIGRRSVTMDSLSRSFTGVVLELTPGPRFAARVPARRSLATYATLFRGGSGVILVMILSAFLLEALGLLFPAASAFVVDFVVRPRQSAWVMILAVAFAIAIALRAAISLARDRILGGLEAQLDVHLAANLVKHILSLPTGFFSQRGAGDLLNRVSALLQARERFARLLVAGFDVLLVLAYAGLMLLYDLRLGGIVVGLQLVTVLVNAFARRRARSAGISRRIAASNAQSALVQAFADPELVKSFGAEALLLSRYAAARSQELNAHADGQAALEPPKQILTLLESASTALVLWVGGSAVLHQGMTLGVFASFLALQTLIAAPLQRVAAVFQDLAELGPLLERVDDVFDTTPERSGTFVPDQIEGAITFEEVSFRYPGKGPLLLDRVSFRLEAGERVAIAGVSGAGKSTIIKLVLGFLQPTSGRILLDGRDLRDYDLDALRSSVGTVLAGGTFFDESLFDNVTLGAPGATPADVRGALQAACVADVVDGLPHGPLTRLKTGAKLLSGGQRQRLLLTRALVKAPSMLFLDEASSALDTRLEQRVQAYLGRMRCTMLIVAHRLSAVALADRILFLRDGQIVQDGPFAALAASEGPFRDLVVASGGPS
ncbi:MAG TPA: peptidase domain-containing ABC transporter [Labilithrix sp.]|nr:peptidase domain-containing ABC transporter [Labilithrix sp.]